MFDSIPILLVGWGQGSDKFCYLNELMWAKISNVTELPINLGNCEFKNVVRLNLNLNSHLKDKIRV
jgi:hypothetical protein